MIAEKDPYIQSAYDQLQEISQNKQKRLEYEARQKAILDHNQSMLEAEQRGREEGRELEAVSIALKMISLDIDDATIIAVTSLSPEKVKSLREDLERTNYIGLVWQHLRRTAGREDGYTLAVALEECLELLGILQNN